MQERWKVVPSYSDYAVSNFGRVKRITPANSSKSYVGRILKPYITEKGYIKASISLGKSKRVYRRVHRLVLEAFVGPCPEGLEVNHKDGNKGNNHLTNLEYVSSRENKHHAYLIGLHSKYSLQMANCYEQGGA
ncbi:hypothetical protein CL634_07295 [bacterium]|nr:hypothetical protein [bacterium]